MGEIGNRHRRHQINRPGHRPPVKQAVSGGPAHRIGRACRNAERRPLIIISPFQHAPIKNARADAAAKHHRRPRAGFEFHLVGRLAQLDVADIGSRDIHHKHHRQHAESQISAAESVGHKSLGVRHPIGTLLGKKHQRQGNAEQNQQHAEKSEFVDARVGRGRGARLEIFIRIKHAQMAVRGGAGSWLVLQSGFFGILGLMNRQCWLLSWLFVSVMSVFKCKTKNEEE